MFENFCSDIIQTMKCFALESFNLNCQAEHTKINSRLDFNPGLALIAFWTTRSGALPGSRAPRQNMDRAPQGRSLGTATHQAELGHAHRISRYRMRALSRDRGPDFALINPPFWMLRTLFL